MRTALVVVGLVAFLALPAFAGAPAPTPAPKAPAAAPVGPGALFVESEPDGASKLVLSGMIRTVWDYQRNYDFDSNKHKNGTEYIDSRVELGFLFQLQEGVEVFLQPQVNYVWGGRRVTTTLDDNAVSGGDTGTGDSAAGDDNLRIYQAYVALHPEFGRVATTLKVGRQELSFGSEMLLGNETRYNGLSFDAVRLDVQPVEGLTTSLFGAKLVENDRRYDNGTSSDVHPSDEADVYLFGLWNTYTGIADTTIDLYALLLSVDRGITDADVSITDINGVGPLTERDVVTVGARVAITPIELVPDHGCDFDLSLEAALQGGSIDDAGNHQRITDAYAFEGELGVTFGDRKTKNWVPRLALGAALASGDEDDDPANDRLHSFQPLFQDTTQRLGEADLVSLSNLKCWFAKASINPTRKVEVGAAYYRFEAMHVETIVGGNSYSQPNNGFPGIDGNDNDLADEVDIYATWKLTKNVTLAGHFAWVDPSDMVRDQDATTLPPDGLGNSPASRLFVCLVVKW